MDQRVFSWLKALPGFRAALAADVNVGLIALREEVRARPVQGFELELLGRLLRDLAAETITALPAYRMAVLTSYTSEPIAHAARVAILREGFFPRIYEAPFGSHRQEILDPNSGLYGLQPDALLLGVSSADAGGLPGAPLPAEVVEQTLEQEVASFSALWDLIAARLGKPIFQHLGEVPEHEFLGVAERRAAWAPSCFVERLNARLLDAAPAAVKWIDVDRLAARVGRQNWRDARLYHHAKFPFALRFLPEYTELLGAALRSAWGRARKALILDLDNTLWGGVIGDDRLEGIRLGPETAEGGAYESFCRYVKALGQRGVILGICSKNDHATAVEVFERHPHMPLTLDDFAVVSCNWSDKATNLAHIALELNLDPSALVFVDDNPAECELIRQSLPEVYTVLMDGDPALFVRKLDHQHLFDAQALSQADLQRSKSYRARAKSIALQAEAVDLDAYLTSLGMKAQLKVAGGADLPRLAQMEMKTNQFNLTTRRLSLERLQAMAAAPRTLIVAVSLEDRFADHGLVSYVAAEVTGDRLVITDWLMSCRVFSRTLEQFVFNHLVQHAIEHDVRTIEVVFKPTAKNRLMEKLFGDLGFSCMGSAPEGPWHYETSPGRAPLKCFIADASVVTGPTDNSMR